MKGIVLTRRAVAAEKRKQDNDDFAGDDDFGGDVFAVEAEVPIDDNLNDPMIAQPDAPDANTNIETNLEKESLTDNVHGQPGMETLEPANPEAMDVVADANTLDSEKVNGAIAPSAAIDTQDRRLTTRRRGPPVGYTMGPAIAIVQSPPEPLGVDHGQRFDRGSYQGRRGGRTQYSGGRAFRGRYDSHLAGSRYVVRDDNFSRSDVRTSLDNRDNIYSGRIRLSANQ